MLSIFLVNSFLLIVSSVSIIDPSSLNKPENIKKRSAIEWKNGVGTGCEFYGDDLETLESTSEQCVAFCAKKDGCTHFTWTSLNEGTCWMKQKENVAKEEAIVSEDELTQCGIDEINWNGKSFALGCDFSGNELKSESTSNYQECGKRCYKTLKCTHWAWISGNDGTCLLKQGLVAREDAIRLYEDKSRACGFLAIKAKDSLNSFKLNEIKWNDKLSASGCEFKGNYLLNERLSSSIKCGDRCFKMSKCTHFTWSSDNGGTCLLKQGSVTKQDAVKTIDKSTICGLIPKKMLKFQIGDNNDNNTIFSNSSNNDITTNNVEVNVHKPSTSLTGNVGTVDNEHVTINGENTIEAGSNSVIQG